LLNELEESGWKYLGKWMEVVGWIECFWMKEMDEKIGWFWINRKMDEELDDKNGCEKWMKLGWRHWLNKIALQTTLI